MKPKSPQQLSNIFPTRLRSALSPILADSPRLQEIRLRSGKPLILNYRSRETFLTESGACTTELAKALTVTEQEHWNWPEPSPFTLMRTSCARAI